MKVEKHSGHGRSSPKVPHEAKVVRPHRRWLYVGLLLAGIVLAAASWLTWYYWNRALPNVAVGSVMVGGGQPAAIRAAIARQAPLLSVTFDDHGQKTTVPAKSLGVVVDEEATLQNVLRARRGSNMLNDAQLWQTVKVPLVLANDPGVLIEYAQQHFPSIFVSAKEPAVTFDDASNQFVVTPGQPGKGLDIKSFERALPQLAEHPQGFALQLTSEPVSPLLDAANLATVRDEANAIISQKVEFKNAGKVVATASPAQIASWMNFTPDAARGTLDLVVDEAKVNQYLNDVVGPKVASAPVDRKVVVDTATGAQSVIQAGQAGSEIQDVDTLAASTATTLGSNKPVLADIHMASAPFRTVTIKGTGKWIEVDLGQQTATMWVGNQKVQSFLISSGRAGTPTELGEFAIYSKTPDMTMTGTIAGDYFYLPNVPWVSFFDGGEAFHGTYWHHNFGHPMSHGCINMTIADAKILYDFAPVGTKVIVHA